MSERTFINQKARAFFDELWKRGDSWKLETSEFEQTKYEREMRSQRSVLLARTGDRLRRGGFHSISLSGCGPDNRPRYLAHCHYPCPGECRAGVHRLQSRQRDGLQLRAEEPWDLVVMNETICYLGWLYLFFDVAWLASELFSATRTGGELLLANTQGDALEPLLRPSIIRTYHDLFVNVGYDIRAEEVFRGTKNGVSIEVLMTLFERM